MAKKTASGSSPPRGAPKPAPPSSRPAPGGSKRSASRLLWITVIIALLLPWILPTMIIVFFGMIPAIVALIVDRTPGKYGALTVAAMNFAGVLPYLVKLWAKSQSLENAIAIIVDVFAIAVMYGAAGFGWMIFMTVPTFVASIILVISLRRVAVLRENQRKIVEEWGESIARGESPAGKA